MAVLSPFPLSDLMMPALLIFSVGLVISWRVTHSVPLTLCVPSIKVFIFLIYYAIFFDGTWTFLDDWAYLEHGEALLGQGVSIFNVWANFSALSSAVGSTHVAYYVFNAEALDLLGPGYFAPVALNITLTFFAAGFMAEAAVHGLHVSRRLAGGLFAFLVLSPSLIAWSTIMNGKDTLVMTGTAMAAYAVSQAEMGRYWRAVLLGLVVGPALLFTRFYTPLLMLAALVGAIVFSRAGRRLPVVGILASVGMGGVLFLLGHSKLTEALTLLQSAFVNPLYGVLRYLLTPIPFNTTGDYSFLDLPQTLHWMLMPSMAYGIYRVWRRATLTGRFMVIYFFLVVALYAMFGELQGPRHRYQLDGLMVVFQFLGLLSIIKQMGSSRPKSIGSGVAKGIIEVGP